MDEFGGLDTGIPSEGEGGVSEGLSEDAKQRLRGRKWQLTPVFRVRARYTSPADGRQHVSDLLLSDRKFRDYDPKHLRLLAHKDNPKEIKPE